MIETQFAQVENYEEVIIDLKTVLKDKKVTPYKLSKMTGIKEDTIYRYCNKKVYRIDIYNLGIICQALKCEPNDIIKYNHLPQ